MDRTTGSTGENRTTWLLDHDLSALTWLFNDGRRTARQDEQYPLPPGARQRIGQASWGNDHTIDQRGRSWQPLMLSSTGRDGMPVTVSDVSPDTGVTFFSYGAIHSFPSEGTLARAARFFRLTVPAWALMHLKGAWEASLGNAVGFTNNVDLDLRDLLTNPRHVEDHRHDGAFQPSEAQTDAALEVYRSADGASDLGFDDTEIADLLREMMLSGLYLHPVIRPDYKSCDYVPDDDRTVWSPELKSFVERFEARRRTLEEASEEERRQFISDRLKWIELSETVTDLEYEIEMFRQKAWNIKNEWDRLFGANYLAFLTAAALPPLCRNAG